MPHQLASFAAVLPLVALGCGGLFAPEPVTPPGFHENLLENPGFEDGEAGWSYPLDSPFWGKFGLVESPVHSGRHAAHLRLRAGREDRSKATWILGVMQEPAPQRFPDVLGGYYRVDTWDKGADVTDLYLQTVAIIWTRDAGRIVDPQHPQNALMNYQVRFYLAGISEPPFLLSNAKLRFVGKGGPELGRWIYFEVPLREAFEQEWGAVPTNYEKIRVLFEARWDNRPPGSRIEADAYFDDLFLGYVDATP